MFTHPDVPFITALLFGPLLVGLFQHLAFEPPARGWHTKLKKSPYRPPGFVFPIAWVWSYLSIGYASYIVYKSQVALIPLMISVPLYIFHLILMNSWGYCCMKLRRLGLALNIMLALDVTASWLLVAVYCIEPFAAALCLPYFFWLLELTYLNMYMERNNPPSHTKQQVLAAHATLNVADVNVGTDSVTNEHDKED